MPFRAILSQRFSPKRASPVRTGSGRTETNEIPPNTTFGALSDEKRPRLPISAASSTSSNTGFWVKPPRRSAWKQCNAFWGSRGPGRPRRFLLAQEDPAAAQTSAQLKAYTPRALALIEYFRTGLHTLAEGTGGARGFVEVPDLLNGRLAVSGVLLHNGTDELHRFHREDSLSYMCRVFHAKSVKGEVRIVREGEQVLAVPATVVANGDGSVTLQGVLPLAALGPGLYSLQAVAKEDAGGDTAASQWTDFEIVN